MKKGFILFLVIISGYYLAKAQPANDNYSLIKLTGKSSVSCGDNQYQTVGDGLSNPLMVQVLKNKTSPVADCPVYFEILSKPSKCEGFKIKDSVAYTDKNGVARTRVILGDKPGGYEIIAKIKNSNPENFQVFRAFGRKSNWAFMLIIGILGGLGIFIFGMNMMSAGMQKSAGDKMRAILSTLTHNRFVALGVGTFITTLTQSSSTTAIMLISFVQSGMMKYAQTLGILLGASIGGTITAQLIAFKVTEYSLILVALGFGLHIFSKSQKIKQVGETILGFGLLFFGMYIMSDAISPMKYYQPFTDILSTLKNPFIGIAIGTIFTAIVQSSGAFIGIIIILGSQGILSLEAGIPLMLGTNLGTAVTAILAAAGANREGRMVAASQTLFKLTGVIIVLIISPYFIEFIKYISPVSSAKAGSLAAMADDVPRQIANAHTIFNIMIAILFLPFVSLIASFVNKIVPRKKGGDEDELKLVFIDENLISTPTLALNLAKQESLRLAETVKKMTDEIILAFTEKKEGVLRDVAKKEKLTDYLYDEINSFLVKVSHNTGHEDRVKETFQMMYVIKEFEQIGDIVSTNLCHYASKWVGTHHMFSEQGKAELSAYHLKTMKQISRSIEVFRDVNLEKAKTMKKKFKKYSEMAEEFEKSHYERMKEDIKQSIESNEIHVELMEMLKTINRHTANIAGILLEQQETKKTKKRQMNNEQ